MSACTAMLQTEPGRCCPVVRTKKTLALDAQRQGVPRSASRTRQPTSVSQGRDEGEQEGTTQGHPGEPGQLWRHLCPIALQRSEDRDSTRGPRRSARRRAVRFLVTGLAHRRRKVQPGDPVCPRVASRDRAPVATHAAHEVTVQVADEHQAEVAGACQDTPDVGRGERPLGVALSERQGDDEQAAGTQCPRA